MTKFLPSACLTAACRCSALTAFLLATASLSQAATVANWDFEDGVAGEEFTPLGTDNESGGSVDTVNGILMRGFNDVYGPSWTAATSDGAGLAMGLDVNTGVNITSDGYVTEGALHNWSPTAWTIETSVYLNDIGGWRTLIGRDGSSQEEPESDFYLVKNGIDNRFRINIDTTGGTRWILDGEPAGGVEANTWYAVAARSDGQTLSLWIDDGFNGYQQAGSLDISAQSAADNALPDTALNWTFGRGWYNGGFVDHVDGRMDNIRFSDTALDPSEFIQLEVASTLTLVVNPDTGAVSLRNDTAGDLGFDYYRIDSPTDGSLSTSGWNSLSDQGVDAVGPGAGESWDEASGAITANLLVEQFLSGETVLAPGESISLGDAYTGSAGGDLEVRYAPTGAGLRRSKVVYSSIELPGDFNLDGSVDAADYTVWRDNEGSTVNLAADASGDGRVGLADYNIWAANYGSVAELATAAPEPTSLLVAMLGMTALIGRRR